MKAWYLLQPHQKKFLEYTQHVMCFPDKHNYEMLQSISYQPVFYFYIQRKIEKILWLLSTLIDSFCRYSMVA